MKYGPKESGGGKGDVTDYAIISRFALHRAM